MAVRCTARREEAKRQGIHTGGRRVGAAQHEEMVGISCARAMGKPKISMRFMSCAAIRRSSHQQAGECKRRGRGGPCAERDGRAGAPGHAAYRLD